METVSAANLRAKRRKNSFSPADMWLPAKRRTKPSFSSAVYPLYTCSAVYSLKIVRNVYLTFLILSTGGPQLLVGIDCASCPRVAFRNYYCVNVVLIFCIPSNWEINCDFSLLQVYQRTYMGLSTVARRRLHVLSPSSAPEASQSRTIASVVWKYSP